MKPLYLFQALMRYLEAQHIVVPGYSVLQDIVSRALAAERQRMTTLIDRALDPVTRAALDALYVNREGVYAITALKHEPKDFSLKELKQEITRNQALSGVYPTACALLAELGISNDSVSYYAALVDYYTVQKLQQLPTGMVYLYLLCFIRHRYQNFHDNLIHALIFQVRKVIDAAKVATQEKILHTQADHQDNLRHLSRILHLFLDDSIADDVTFGDVKRRAFAILDRDRVQQLSQSMQNPSGQDRVWEWDFIAAEAPAFKQHLRPVIMALSFAGHQGDQALLDAVEFLKTSFDKGRSLTRYRLDQIPQAFIPSGLRPYLYEEDDQGQKRLHPDKYEFLVYRLLRNHLEAGDVYVSDSLRFRTFEEDLIPCALIVGTLSRSSSKESTNY